jgi:hypothetical protein
MSVKEAMQREVGTIGQRYENRKNKKTGILEERDEKHKQLIFKADDGSSFIVMYSTFRSDWRKVKDGESEVKIDTKKPETKPVKEKSDKPVSNKKDKALTDKEHHELRMQTMDAVVEATESLGLDCKVRITGKTKGISVKMGKFNNMEVYVENKDTVRYVIFVRNEVQLPKTYGAEYEYHDNFNLKHKYIMSDLHLKEFIKALKSENTNKEEK